MATKKVPAKKAPTKKASSKKPKGIEDPNPIFQKSVNSRTLKDLQAMEDSVRKKKYGTRKPTNQQLTAKSAQPLSGRAMRGGKRQNASNLGGN